MAVKVGIGVRVDRRALQDRTPAGGEIVRDHDGLGFEELPCHLAANARRGACRDDTATMQVGHHGDSVEATAAAKAASSSSSPRPGVVGTMISPFVNSRGSTNSSLSRSLSPVNS